MTSVGEEHLSMDMSLALRAQLSELLGFWTYDLEVNLSPPCFAFKCVFSSRYIFEPLR